MGVRFRKLRNSRKSERGLIEILTEYKKEIWQVLAIVVMTLGLYGVSKVVMPMFEDYGNYVPQGYGEFKEAENQKLLDDFEYVGDKEYIVETKGIQGLVNPFSGEKKLLHYIGIQEEGTDYLLSVTKEIYESVEEQESIVMKVGQDGRYVLSKFGDVVVKSTVDKQGE